MLTIVIIHVERNKWENDYDMFGKLEDIESALLSKLTLPGLDFTLVTDLDVTKNPIRAAKLFQKLRSCGRLKACNIHYQPSTDNSYHSSSHSVVSSTALQQKAQDLALASTGNLQPQGSFPFMRLPSEVRILILSHTDLVNRQHFAGPKIVFYDDGILGQEERCCWRCTPHPDAACCCRYIGSAFSQTCTCKRIPTSLLCVSREMCADARAVLLKYNRFVLQGSPCNNQFILRKFSSWPQFHFLHQLELSPMDDVFKDVYSWQKYMDSEGWADLIAFIANELNIPQLNLSINGSRAYVDSMSYNPQEASELFSELVKVYENAMQPFTQHPQLRKLKSFHVYWPVLHLREKWAEKLIMGQAYDSAKTGKIGWQTRNYRDALGPPREEASSKPSWLNSTPLGKLGELPEDIERWGHP